jgi:copper resistance protein C
MEMNHHITLPRLVLAALLIAMAAPSATVAHAELSETTPAADERLEIPPTEVVLVFDDELDSEQSSFVVTGADGAEVGRGEVDLAVAGRNEMRGDVEIVDVGEYLVAWTVVAADGHPDEGSFTFTYETADPTEAPDTAMPPPAGPEPLVLAGGTLLALALLLVVARLSSKRLRRR